MIEMDEMKGRGKRGLLRVVFGRTMFFLLFIALQLAFFFWIYVWLDNKYQAGDTFFRFDQCDPHDPYSERKAERQL
mgnify:CR=1 FL=1